MKYILFGSALGALAASQVSADHNSTNYAVAAAELALPAALEDNATIISVDADGAETVVREGSSGISCRISNRDDDDASNRLNVWCVPDAMTALVARGRELRQSGVPREEAMAKMRAETESGELDVSSFPQVGYAFRGAADTFGKDVTTVEGESWQIIVVPFATGESLGVSEEPEGSMPWGMASGTPFAHIMVSGASDEEFE